MVASGINQEPMTYPSKTYAEGRALKGASEGPNYVAGLSNTAGKAMHHPRAGSPHVFPGPKMANAHSFGSQHAGKLRVSGVKGAHRLGGK
jgi:hypothetical protein